MEKGVRRRLSFIYLLHMGGSFIFLFLIISALLQYRWRKLGTDNEAVAFHTRFQWFSLGIFIVVAGFLVLIRHEVSQLLLAYGLMFFNLARAAYGSFKLRMAQKNTGGDQNLSLRT